MEELEWAVANGHRGVVISSFPNGSLESDPEDAPFWHLAEEIGAPIAVHIGSFIPATSEGGGKKIDMESLAMLGKASSASTIAVYEA